MSVSTTLSYYQIVCVDSGKEFSSDKNYLRIVRKVGSDLTKGVLLIKVF